MLSDCQERSQILKEMKTTPVNFENKFQGIIFCSERQGHISLRGQRDKPGREHDLVVIQIEQAEKRRDSVDTYFTVDNKWLRKFVETGGPNELNKEQVHNLIEHIDICPDKQIKITYNFSDWMEPFIDCIEKLKQMANE